MPQTLLPWLEEAFPEVDAPYSLSDILDRVQSYHSPTMSRSAIYRAWRSLRASSATRGLVRALNQDEREKTYLFSAEAARRIAKRATRARLLASAKQKMKR